MSADSFYSIPVGASREEVIAQAGDPAAIRNKGGNVQEYVYIERLTAGNRLLQETRYIFTLQDGKVVSKHVERNSPAPTRFDSYEMQTTQKNLK